MLGRNWKLKKVKETLATASCSVFARKKVCVEPKFYECLPCCDILKSNSGNENAKQMARRLTWFSLLLPKLKAVHHIKK